MKDSRFEYIDRLKGFAILIVVMGHYVFFTLNQTDVLSEIIGSFQMPLFMFLSGYVISSIPSPKKCCTKVIQFMLPMIMIGALFVAFSGSTLMEWIHTPFKHGYWYLYVLSVFYIFLFISGLCVDGKIGMIVSSVLIYALLLVADRFVPTYYNNIFSIWMLKLYWPFFIIAFLIRRYNLLQLILTKNYFFSLSLIGYIIGFLLYKSFPNMFHVTAFLFISICFLKQKNMIILLQGD